MTSTDTLLPCPVPWCGSDVLEVVRSPWSRGYCITCQSCGVQSPSRETEAEATAAWNRRTTPTPATDAREAVAQALYDHESPNSALAWEHKPAHFQENVRRFADAALLALTPFIAASIRTPPTPAAEEREAVAQWCSGCHEVRSVDCYRAGCPKSDTERRAAEILAAEANERARIVAWLRGNPKCTCDSCRRKRIWANAIERNEHGAGK